MSLLGALNIGKSALATHQAAIQVTGNNISNAGNPDYSRQVSRIVPARDQELRPGQFVGTGVTLAAIERQVDEALQGRLRNSYSDAQAATTHQQWLGRVESLFNELTDDDISTAMSRFFGGWSNLANKPQDVGLRQVVIQEGDALAGQLRQLRLSLDELQKDVDQRLAALVKDADALASQVADLNRQIVEAEGGTGGQSNGLRDQRDAVLKRLSELMDVQTVEMSDGTVNVLVGSEPLVWGTLSMGVTVSTVEVDGEPVQAAAFAQNKGVIRLTSGQLGGLAQARTSIGSAIREVDELAGGLIFELNKVHASGQGLIGLGSAEALRAVSDADAPLNDPSAGLAFQPSHGSLVVHVRQKGGGLETSTLIRIDLDGAGGDDTTLESLRQDLDAIAGVNAVIAGGKLRIAADSPALEVTFSQDSSGVLAALGINAFFAGADARDIAVAQAVRSDPRLLAASANGEAGDNRTALAIAALETASLQSMGGLSLRDRYQQTVNRVAVEAAGATTAAEATRIVQQTLESQREALSGVSLDEEAINLIRQQRAFQSAARLISTIDELMRTLLQMA